MTGRCVLGNVTSISSSFDSLSRSLHASFMGAFHNPEFHRDITRCKLVRIMRRGPPPPSAKKKVMKAIPPRRKARNRSRHDDEWQPGNAAPTVAANGKRRPTRTANKIAKPAWGDSDEESGNHESPLQSKAKQKSLAAFSSSQRGARGGVDSIKSPRPHWDAEVKLFDFHNKSIPLKAFTPTRRFGNTPRNVGASLLSCDADDSPTANWSPLIGGLIRHESIIGVKSDPVTAQSTKNYNFLGVKGLRHPYETCWTQWNQNSQQQVGSCRDRDTSSRHNARCSSLLVTKKAESGQVDRNHDEVAGQIKQTSSSRVMQGPHPSPAAECPLNSVLSHSKPTVSAPPLLSRESSAPIPIALVQRVSSSFFLPFIGMADSLSYALELHNDSGPSTPSRLA